jgi:hypothetical protein
LGGLRLPRARRRGSLAVHVSTLTVITDSGGEPEGGVRTRVDAGEAGRLRRSHLISEQVDLSNRFALFSSLSQTPVNDLVTPLRILHTQ